MAEDLKRQASELYKEHSLKEEIPTSDSLSMKKIIYVSLGILVALAVVIYSLGGFKKRTDPIIAAATPRTITKEAPPPEPPAPVAEYSATQGANTPPAQPRQTAAAFQSGGTPANPASGDKTQAARALEATSHSETAARRQEVGKEARKMPAITKTSSSPGSEGKVVESRPTPMPAPAVSPLEIARQELARDVVLEKNPAMLRLTSSPDDNLEYKGWKAIVDGGDDYQVIFTFQDKTSGAGIQYVWRVNLTARTISPQSYYARKLS